MGKVIFWIVVVFVVLFVLRLVNAATGKRRRDEAVSRSGGTPADRMVRCLHCGLFLPQAEAKAAPGGFVCADGRCGQRR